MVQMIFLFKQVILRDQPLFFQGVIYREQADWKGTYYLKGFDITKPPICSLELKGFLPSLCFKVHLRSKTSPPKVSSCKLSSFPCGDSATPRFVHRAMESEISKRNEKWFMKL